MVRYLMLDQGSLTFAWDNRLPWQVVVWHVTWPVRLMLSLLEITITQVKQLSMVILTVAILVLIPCIKNKSIAVKLIGPEKK